MPKIFGKLAKARKRRAEIKCQHCGYVWFTNASNWKSRRLITLQGKKVKVLHCPMCNAKIKIEKKQYKKILAIAV